MTWNPSAYHIPPRNSWKICIDRPFLNCERIYPLQQRKVRALLDALEGKPGIRRATVFGSSVTERCHMGSDVDMYVETDAPGNPFAQESGRFDFEYDVWTNLTADDRLLNEISRKGVIVYDAGKDVV